MLFWNCDNPADAGSAVVAQSRRDDSINESRRSQAIKYAGLYEGLQLSSLSPCGYAIDNANTFWGTEVPIVRNTCYAAVDTFVSKIAALDTPKPAMLTTEGSWKDRRQAEDLERLVEAEYLSPKGEYSTLNELWIHAFRVAAAAPGSVIVRFYNDCGKVGAKIHDTLDCSISKDGSWCILKTWYEVDDAVDLFPDREADLRAAAADPPLEYRAPQAVGVAAPQMVCIFEGWKGAVGDKPGVYVAAIDKDVEALVFEEYPHSRPPIVKLDIIPHLYGPWAHSLTHHMYESIYRDNVLLQAVDRSISKTNKQTTYADRSKLDDPDSLEKIDDNQVVYVKAGYQPVTVNAPGFNAAHLDVADRHKADAHSITGVSEMHSGGRKEPGLDSGIAQRYVAALINERFAAVQRRYVQAVAVDSAKVIIQILCDIYQDDRKMTRHWPGQDSLREVSASVALRGIDSLKYVVQPAAVSGSKNSPADRQQSAFEYFQAGLLTPDQYAGLQHNGYDLPEALEERDVQREWVEKQMYRYMFASDKEVAKPTFYVPPLRGINVGRATLQVIDGFMEAQMGQLEDERLEFYLMLLADLGSMAANDVSASPVAPPNNSIATAAA